MKQNTIPEISQFEAGSRPFPLADYWRPINQSKSLILLLMVVAAATSFFIGKDRAVFQATATITLDPAATTVLSDPTAINQVIGGDDFLRRVIAETKVSDSIPALRKKLHAENPTSTSLITIGAADQSAPRAAMIANAAGKEFAAEARKLSAGPQNLQDQLELVNAQIGIIDALLKQRTSGTEKAAGMPNQLREIDDEIASARQALSNLSRADMSESNKAVFALATNQRLSSLETRRESLVQEELDLLSHKQSLLAARQTLAADLDKTKLTKLFMRATVPSVPVSPDMNRNVILSALAALIAGIGLAIARKPTAKTSL